MRTTTRQASNPMMEQLQSLAALKGMQSGDTQQLSDFYRMSQGMQDSARQQATLPQEVQRLNLSNQLMEKELAQPTKPMADQTDQMLLASAEAMMRSMDPANQSQAMQILNYVTQKYGVGQQTQAADPMRDAIMAKLNEKKFN